MRIGVVGAMGVGKTTIIEAARRRCAAPPNTEFVEMRLPLPQRGARPRVDVCIIVVEKNRYSMLWLERTILEFRAVPTVIIQMTHPLPFASTAEELAPFLDIIKKYNMDMFLVDYNNMDIASALERIGLSL
jgi:hypothetical protein